MPLDITEYDNMPRDGSGASIPTGLEPALVNQQVAISGVSAQSAALNSSTRFVRLHTDVACRVAFGSNPTAAGTDRRMAAGQTEYIGVRAGGLRIAVISTT